MISVIIPCYNQAQYLQQAIESVLAQTYKDFEILVVNDGSTDQTAEVAASFSGVRCIAQKNQGQAAARNAGLHESKGEFLVFLDADDRLMPTALEAGLSGLNKRPDCAFIYGRCRIIAPDGSELPEWPQPLYENDHYRQLLKDNYIFSTGRVLYRRSPIEEIGGFNHDVVPSEDYDLYLRITQKFPICCHSEVVSEYRRHPQQVSVNSAVMLRATLTVLRAQHRNVRGNPELEEAYGEGLQQWEKKYGGALIHQIRYRFRKPRHWNRVFSSMKTLLRYSPLFTARNLFRKKES